MYDLLKNVHNKPTSMDPSSGHDDRHRHGRPTGKLNALLGPERAGLKPVLVLGSHLKDQEAVRKANEQLEKERRKQSIGKRSSLSQRLLHSLFGQE